MKRISFEIKDHADRMDLLKALADNGYAVKVEQRTEYFTRRTLVVVWVNDSEVEG